jgi:hypothetical protein
MMPSPFKKWAISASTGAGRHCKDSKDMLLLLPLVLLLVLLLPLGGASVAFAS